MIIISEFKGKAREWSFYCVDASAVSNRWALVRFSKSALSGLSFKLLYAI